ncbi:MAG: Single-stranded DNA-binding protein [Alphaproteobacteria bacterium MarineAlpha9_Bin4]|nr:MAG: Single-stranded DNA-binding protein [Alphaproteobacteria bacterium MarineAlpha9_Bin4]|tara:strand:+ start:66 stop:545 length:480 start_codon:yes stop_codon:yes gene_type:complete
MFMAYSINKVTLVGNVGNDPEVKTFQNGNKVVNLSLATSERWKDKESGEIKSNTEWHRIAIFNVLLADIAEKYIKKGAKIYLEGQLQTRKWQDSNGVDKYTTEVVVQNYRGELVLLDRSNDNNSLGNYEDQNKSSKSSKETSNKEITNELDSLEDDIPF